MFEEFKKELLLLIELAQKASYYDTQFGCSEKRIYYTKAVETDRKFYDEYQSFLDKWKEILFKEGS